MDRKDYAKIIARIKTVGEFKRDCQNKERCEANLQRYDRVSAWQCLQDMLHEYAAQIETFGVLVDGIGLINGGEPEILSDQVVKMQLQYIERHIPVYVLLREGEKELAKRMCEWIEENFTH